MRELLSRNAGRISDRYKLLVEQLKAEHGASYGWKASVARTLGVSGSYIGKIETDELGLVGLQIVERAVENLQLDPLFFFGEFEAEPHFRDWIVRPDEHGLYRHAEAKLEGVTIPPLPQLAEWKYVLDAALRVIELAVGDPGNEWAAAAEKSLAKQITELPIVRFASKLVAGDTGRMPEDAGLRLAQLVVAFQQEVAREGRRRAALQGVAQRAVEPS